MSLLEASESRTAHTGDSTLYMRLVSRVDDIRALWKKLKTIEMEDEYELLVRDENAVHDAMLDQEKITAEQRNRLRLLLSQKDGTVEKS